MCGDGCLDRSVMALLQWHNVYKLDEDEFFFIKGSSKVIISQKQFDLERSLQVGQISQAQLFRKIEVFNCSTERKGGAETVPFGTIFILINYI